MNADPARHRYDSILDTIGDTPLIRLHRVVDGARTPVWIKAESFNPGGSVKDRIGLAIIEAAERDGTLKPGGTVVEGTSGNTGVGLAIAAAIKGYRCIFTIPDKMSNEKVRLLKSFGAEVIVTPTAVPPDHPDYYGNVAKRIVAETPNSILADQFFNPVNPEAHYRSTGPELWEQTEGRITHLVTAPGTGGTISGVGRYLKEQNPAVRVIAGDPYGSIFTHYATTGEKIEGEPYKVEGIGNDKIPSTLHFDVIDEFRTVTDPVAFGMTRRLTREEGLFSGGSTGLIVHIAVELAHEVDDAEAMIVCFMCDTGERYLSKVYNDEWMQENRMFVGSPRTVGALLGLKRAAGGPELVSVSGDDTIAAALELIEAHDVSQLPILANGRIEGSITEASLLAAVVRDPESLERPVSSLAGPALPEVAPETAIDRLSSELSREVPAVVVCEEGRIVGVLTRHDVLHYLLGR